MLIRIQTPEIPWDTTLPAGWTPDMGYDVEFATFDAEERAALAPPPDVSVSEFADNHRVLQAGVSRNPGQWDTSYTPYLRPVMDAYRLPNVRHLVLCFGTQLGKTETLFNILLYIIGHEPYSTLLMYPREDDAKTVSRTRVQPMIDDCRVLREKKPAKADLYQSLEMHFPGMILYLTGANSLAALAQKPCRNILRDEIDKYPERLGKDADPLSKSEERAKSYWDIRKIVDVSSPTFEGTGILKQLDRCHVVYRIHHPCPHCGELQELEFKQIKWDDRPDDPDRILIAKKSAVYICRHCGSEITNDHRPWMIANYEYLPDRELTYEPERIGFWVSSLSSPMLTWGDVAEAFLEAERERDEKGDTTMLQSFINDWLAEAWKEAVKKSSDEAILSRRCELEPLVVPEAAIALTAGIDVQKFGFWFTVWAWTGEMESWLIHYGFLPAWDDVLTLCFNTTFAVQGSRDRMAIWRAAMDTGGGEDSQWGEDWTKTEEIMTWIRENGQGIVHGVKGMSRPTGAKIKHSVIDRMPGAKGGLIPGGMSLWLLDTHQLKDTFFWRMSNSGDDPQQIHLHKNTGRDFTSQILAEEKQRNKNGKWRYVQVKKDNHLLDAAIYAHAAADFQWQGGVKILAGRVGVSGPAGGPAARGPFSAHSLPLSGRPVRRSHDRADMDRNRHKKFRRPEWLRNRR